MWGSLDVSYFISTNILILHFDRVAIRRRGCCKCDKEANNNSLQIRPWFHSIFVNDKCLNLVYDYKIGNPSQNHQLLVTNLKFKHYVIIKCYSNRNYAPWIRPLNYLVALSFFCYNPNIILILQTHVHSKQGIIYYIWRGPWCGIFM